MWFWILIAAIIGSYWFMLWAIMTDRGGPEQVPEDCRFLAFIFAMSPICCIILIGMVVCILIKEMCECIGSLLNW